MPRDVIPGAAGPGAGAIAASEHAVAILGDAWTILIIREAFKGARRFGEWRQRLPIPQPVLADRLRRLVGFGILDRWPDQDKAGKAYRLTSCGLELWTVLVAMWKWQRDFLPGSPPGARKLRHMTCGAIADVALRCGHCAAVVHPEDTALAASGEVAATAREIPRYRRSVAAPRRRDAELRQPMLAIIGDQASARLLAAFFKGAHGFEEIRAQLRMPSALLANRLATFSRVGIVRGERHRENGRRKFYRLTPKGLALYPVVLTIVDWGCRWFGDGTPGMGIVHRGCGAALVPRFHCLHCEAAIERREIRMES